MTFPAPLPSAAAREASPGIVDRAGERGLFGKLDDQFGARDWAIRLAIMAVFFAATAPTLFWIQFYHAEENVVIAQALEMRRTGNWLIPTLQGRPRTIKPPLAVWISALAIRRDTLAAINNPNEAVRAAAYRDLSFQTRYPALIVTGLMLVAVYELGRAIGSSGADGHAGRALGLASACVCGASWYVLVRQGTKSTVDIHLALWITATSAFLAWGVLRGRWWTACLGAGVTLGLATMSKGPAVPLLQSVLPVVAYAWWRRGVGRHDDSHADAPRAPIPIAAILLGLVFWCAVGMWWYLLAYVRNPHILSIWWAELTRYGANDMSDPPEQYLRSLRLMFPWIAWMFIGLASGAVLLKRKRSEPWLLAFFLTVLPLVIMQCFRERKERYMLPLVCPLSVVTAWALLQYIARRGASEAWERFAVIVHWAGLAVVAVGVPVAGAMGWMGMQTTAHAPWFSVPVAVVAGGAMVVVLIGGMVASRRSGAGGRWGMLACTVAVLLIVQAPFAWGFSRHPSGTRDQRVFADFIWANYPTAALYSSNGGNNLDMLFMPGVDLAIYANRQVIPVADLGTLKPAAVPTLALVQARRKEPLAPPGWREVRRLDQQNGYVCKLLLLPPSSTEH